MGVWERLGKFYGAKDPAYAWPITLVHLNIILYALTYWVCMHACRFMYVGARAFVCTCEHVCACVCVRARVCVPACSCVNM
jgi:hypothetical protein